ncbi:cytochrome P450 [Mycena maculata]|uniref:Cytochrome P450 n=1 Tax=Mycena maculata TaxID=230809 RepID=A0AAD7N548_9AGAR|nr:cytochrome P450 [Mycena maculata]
MSSGGSPASNTYEMPLPWMLARLRALLYYMVLLLAKPVRPVVEGPITILVSPVDRDARATETTPFPELPGRSRASCEPLTKRDLPCSSACMRVRAEQQYPCQRGTWNMHQLFHSNEYGEHEFKWQETYGTVYSINGCFGSSRLMISDPLTMKYVLNSPVFTLGPSLAKGTNVLFGNGNVTTTRGQRHRHIRGIMNPYFTSNKIRNVIPIIKETARRLVGRWEALGFPGTTVDISRTLNDAALDLTGDGDFNLITSHLSRVILLSAVLEYPFNALGGQSELATMQRTLINSLTTLAWGQVTNAVLPYVPDSVFHFATRFLIPTMLEYHKITDKLGRNLVELRPNDAGTEADQSFVNRLTAHNRIPKEEIGVHLRTILIAGQDTTGGTLGWILYKLAEMRDFQDALRKEIQLAGIDDDFDYDSMQLLNAVINEVLRLYPSLPLAERAAAEDCILPLSKPITTAVGEQISEIPIKKGQSFYVAISSYHRLPSIWGPDAQDFRPSRWLEKEPCKGPALGPHASLILELQVVVVELVAKFVLSLPENDSVRPRFQITLVPETADGTHCLPVHIETVTA